MKGDLAKNRRARQQAAAAGASGADGVPVMHVTPAQWAKLELGVFAFKNRGEGYS